MDKKHTESLPDGMVMPGNVTDEELTVVAGAFAALGSEHRLAIVLRLVRAGPSGMAMGELGDAVGVTGSVLPHHLKHLVAAQLVVQWRDGRRVLNRVDTDYISILSEFLLAECCVDERAPEGHYHG